MKIRYGKRFVIIVLAGIVLTGTLLIVAHPELWIYSLFLISVVILCIAAIVATFDYCRYRLYLKKIRKFYREHQAGKEFELKFDEQQLVVNGRETAWSALKYYYVNKQDIYLFKNKRVPALLCSEVSVGKDSYRAFTAYAANNLKVLPTAKQIIFYNR